MTPTFFDDERRARWRSSRDMHAKARAARKQPTPAEDTLWAVLRNRQLLDHHFRRQYAVGPYIVDFYCAKGRLIIEVDGAMHLQQQNYDHHRETWLVQRLESRILRFTNEEVLEALADVTARIREALRE